MTQRAGRDKKDSDKMWLIIIVVLVASLSYFKGYNDGETSVYEKAKNNEEILELYR